MKDEITHPISLGNVTYLNGDPPQDALASFAQGMAYDAELEAAISAFSETLLERGRPGDRKYIVVEYGPRLADHIAAGSFIKRAPWQGWHNSPRIPIFEMHATTSAGWCAEVCDGVMLHIRFDGYDGLSSQEMACLLSESKNPAPELLAWLQKLISDDYSFDYSDVLNEMPEVLKECLGYSFRFGGRRISMWLGGDEEEARFMVSEIDRNIEQAFNL